MRKGVRKRKRVTRDGERERVGRERNVSDQRRGKCRSRMKGRG